MKAGESNKLQLKNVTSIFIETRSDIKQLGHALSCIDLCCEYVDFYESVFITSITNKDLIPRRFKTYYLDPEMITTVEDHSKFTLRNLNDYFESEFVLTLEQDGFVLNPAGWNDANFNYDYIGAPWLPGNPAFSSTDQQQNVGNGGFSLRSKKLCEITQTYDGLVQYFPEDVILCNKTHPEVKVLANGKYFTDMLKTEWDIRFAPVEIAERFSKEHGQWNGQFGFHSWSTDLRRWQDYSKYFG